VGGAPANRHPSTWNHQITTEGLHQKSRSPPFVEFSGGWTSFGFLVRVDRHAGHEHGLLRSNVSSAMGKGQKT
jgi:hypothetical protein